MKSRILISVLLCVITLSCKKKSTTPVNSSLETGKVTIEVQHLWNDSTRLELNKVHIHSITADTIEFTNFKYYLTNIRLKKEDGSWWIHPNSYHLVNLAESSSLNLILNDVPIGNYIAVSYLLGVDSLHNVSGAQEGALSTVNGMFWSWNSGYIQMKAEGISPNASSGSFAYHIGGFSGAFSPLNLHENEFITKQLTISTSSTNTITLSCYPEKIWSDTLQLANTSVVHNPNKISKSIALGFFGSFKVSDVSN